MLEIVRWLLAVTMLVGAGFSSAAVVGTSVPATANGMFGQFGAGLNRDDTGGDYVPYFEFDAVGSITFFATGLISLNPSAPAQFQNISPDGAGPFSDRVTTLGNANGYVPIEEQIVDAAGVLPLEFTSGDLLGAFVPQSVVDDPDFVPKNDELVGVGEVGILSDALFRIGSGQFIFDAPGPGTLFLGINDPLASNNVGEFTVTTVPIPGAAPLLGSAMVWIAIRRRRNRRST